MAYKHLLAAFDVGGSKTDSVLFNERGEILARVKGEGGNPLERGIDNAAAHYAAILNKLFLEGTGDETAPIDALYGAVAAKEYFGSGLEDRLSVLLPRVRRLRIEGDGCALISGMLGHRDGACMICGTGSSVYIRQGDDYCHIGGWGHLIDTCGSGYMLGRLAIRAACRAYDGRGEQTMLCDLLEKQCGEPIWEHFIELYRGERPYIATFAHTVFEARAMGDPVASAIFDEGARDLAEIAHAAARRLGKPFDLVLNGGIFTAFSEYARAVGALCPPRVNIVYSDVPPIYGGAVEAMYEIGQICEGDFRATFLEGLG
jgi:N-acetylglucosamine kinase-like BadF-type ATPase